MQYHFKIYKEKNGYWAKCIELEGCNTQGDTIEELKLNSSEALNLFLNEAFDSKTIFPLPRKNYTGKDIFKIHVNPKIAFAQILRMERNKQGLSQKEVADMIGLKNLYSYQRLESPKSANPALLTISKIKQIFPDLNLDLVV